MICRAQNCADADLKAVSRWEVLSLLPNATVSTENVEKTANRGLYISDWNSLPPTPLAGGDLKEQSSSLADLNEYSISKSTGPDDSFFHPSGHSHKYSNLKGGSSSSSWRRWWQEWRGRDGRSRLKKSRSGESPSARTLHLAAQVTWRLIFICMFSQSKYTDHQHFTVLQILFYSSLKKQRIGTLTDG